MSTMPPQDEDSHDVEEAYRRWSAKDGARPGESVAGEVLAHARRIAAERHAERPAERPAAASSTRPRRGEHWKMPLFGALAAATFAGFLVIPRILRVDPVPIPAAANPASREEASAGIANFAAQVASPAPAASTVSPADSALSDSPTNRSAAAGSPKADVLAKKGLASTTRRPSLSADRAQESLSSAAAAAAAEPGANVRESAQRGDAQGIAAALQSTKAGIDARDLAGRTALMLAVQSGHREVVDALLARGADPNLADAYGMTPLQAAVAGNFADIAAALQRAGGH